MELNEVKHHMKVRVEGEALIFTVQAIDADRREVYLTANYAGHTIGEWYPIHSVTPKS